MNDQNIDTMSPLSKRQGIAVLKQGFFCIGAFPAKREATSGTGSRSSDQDKLHFSRPPLPPRSYSVCQPPRFQPASRAVVRQLRLFRSAQLNCDISQSRVEPRKGNIQCPLTDEDSNDEAATDDTGFTSK